MDAILRTKLAPPRLRTALVARDALLTRLDQALEHKLTLLSAPAGFGKTTLVCQWLAKLKIENRVPSGRLKSPADSDTSSFLIFNFQFNVAWVALDAGDEDPVRFWRYVATACQAAQGDAESAALALLDAAQQPRFETVLTALINDMAQLTRRCVLMLEDYHVIAAASQVHAQLAFLLDHLPTTLHIMLLTRSDPPLPLARLRAHNDLFELRAADLRFSSAESQAFIQQSMPFPLAAEAIARLDARTEGWVAGLRLATLSLQGRSQARDVEHMLATFAGSHRHIAEYLVADVLTAQPDTLQEFLLRTSFLSRLTGTLCDAVADCNDSALMLEQLEHANLFLFPLDGAGEWYRYHTLFAEAMQHEARRRFDQAALRTLHERASHWYEEHGLLAEAVDSALTAHAHAHAVGLIEQILGPIGIPDEVHTLRRWIEQLPVELISTRPALCFAYAIAILFTEDRRAPATQALVQPPLQLAETRWRAEGNQAKLGEALAFRALVAIWQDDYHQAFSSSRQALTLLSPDENFWSGVCLLNIGMEELFTGQIAAALQTMIVGRARCAAAENSYGVRAATLMLGEMRIWQGQLHQAELLYRQVLDEAGDDHFDQGSALCGLATVAYEQNDLQAAEQEATQALAIGRQHADSLGQLLVEETLLAPCLLVLARVLQAHGQIAQAQQQLQVLADQAARRGWERLHSEVLAAQARLALTTGDLAAVQRWATTSAQHNAEVALLSQERDALIVARMLIAQGEIGPALRALERWHAIASAQGRTHGELEILILLALAHYRSTDLAQAKHRLTQALERAHVEGFQRLFLDEGAHMAALLQAVLPDLRTALARYARTLLHAFLPDQETSGQGDRETRGQGDKEIMPTPSALLPVSSSPLLPVSASLIEPLSPQEQRVLRLLAAGLSNPEIAQELIVSVNTVKTQVQSIYRKLNVSSRREVRAVARQLSLS